MNVPVPNPIPYRASYATPQTQADFVERLARIADRAWRGYSSHQFDWRVDYYARFSESSVFNKSFAIVEFFDEQRNHWHDCAFAGILPLRPRIADLHRRGSMSQYSFLPEHFIIHQTSPTIQSNHYFQSLYMEPEHHQRFGGKQVLREAILKLLARQKCGYENRPSMIYAETSFDEGKKLLLKRGFKPSGSRSSEGHLIYCFDSEDPDSPKTSMWNSIYG